MAPNRAIVVAFCVLETRDGAYFVNEQIAEYLAGLESQFDEILLVANHTDRDQHSCRLDTTSVKPYAVRGRDGNSIPVWLVSILIANLKLLLYADRDSAVIYNYPALIYALMIPFLSVRAATFTGYVAMDPWSTAQLHLERNTLGGRFRSWIVGFEFRRLEAASGTLLVRGTPDRYASHGNVHGSRPIVKLVDRDSIEPDESDDFVVLYIGGFYRRKGIETLIRAFAALLGDDLDQRLILRLVGGSGTAEQDRLAGVAEELGVADCVEFVGTLDDRRRIGEEYLRADMFVLPSLRAEGFPRVIEEAQYYGVPIVSSQLDSFAELLKDGEQILYAEPGDKASFHCAMRRLVTDQNLRESLAKVGQSHMDQKLAENAAEQHGRLMRVG